MPPCQLTMGFAVMFKVPNTFFLNSLIHTLIQFVQHDCNVQYFVFFCILCCDFKLVLFQLDDLCVSKHKNERRVKSSDDDQSIVRWIP